MPKDMAHEPLVRETHDHRQEKSAERPREADDKPTECGLTRAELRALVVEMIG